ncbi:MAG: hypothetical protein ACREV6_20520 [Clostridium sp.]
MRSELSEEQQLITTEYRRSYGGEEFLIKNVPAIFSEEDIIILC